MVSVTTQPIDVTSVLGAIRTPRSGGINFFLGAVRDHSGGKRVHKIEYSAYVPMAEKQMSLIEEEMRQQWELHEVVLIHRIGMLYVGEDSVVTAVSAAHRKESFAACRYAIDRIKDLVPIWKREFFDEGDAWAAGRQDGDPAVPSVRSEQ